MEKKHADFRKEKGGDCGISIPGTDKNRANLGQTGQQSSMWKKAGSMTDGCFVLE